MILMISFESYYIGFYYFTLKKLSSKFINLFVVLPPNVTTYISES